MHQRVTKGAELHAEQSSNLYYIIKAMFRSGTTRTMQQLATPYPAVVHALMAKHMPQLLVKHSKRDAVYVAHRTAYSIEQEYKQQQGRGVKLESWT